MGDKSDTDYVPPTDSRALRKIRREQAIAEAKEAKINAEKVQCDVSIS